MACPAPSKVGKSDWNPVRISSIIYFAEAERPGIGKMVNERLGRKIRRKLKGAY